jgi:hypothetical protein
VFFIVKQKHFFLGVCGQKSKGFLSGVVQDGLWNEALPWQDGVGWCDGSAGACGMERLMADASGPGKLLLRGL